MASVGPNRERNKVTSQMLSFIFICMQINHLIKNDKCKSVVTVKVVYIVLLFMYFSIMSNYFFPRTNKMSSLLRQYC